MREYLTIMPTTQIYPEPGVLRGWLSPHDRSRSFLASLALKTGYEWFLWVDDDMGGVPQTLIDMLFASAKAAPDCVMMTAVYVCRHFAGRGQIAFNFNPKFEVGEPGKDIAFYQHGGVHEIFGCGFGFVFTHRSVFEQMQVPASFYSSEGYEDQGRCVEGRAYFLPLVEGGHHLGEDRSFCARVAKQDLGRMYVDTRIVVPHAGHDLKSVLETQAAKAAREPGGQRFNARAGDASEEPRDPAYSCRRSGGRAAVRVPFRR